MKKMRLSLGFGTYPGKDSSFSRVQEPIVPRLLKRLVDTPPPVGLYTCPMATNSKKNARWRRQETSRLQDALVSALTHLSHAQQTPLSQIELVWPQVCGDELAAQVKPIAMIEGRLKVESRDAHWAAAFAEVERGILARLRQTFGPIKGLDHRVAVHWHHTADTPPRERSMNRPKSAPSETIDAALSRLLAARKMEE